MVDTIIPLSEPLRCVDGTVITEVPVPKGTTILLNLRACNTTKALWGEDACEWKPERWLRPLPKPVEDARIPGIYANLYVLLIPIPPSILRHVCLTHRMRQDDVHQRRAFIHVRYSVSCLVAG